MPALKIHREDTMNPQVSVSVKSAWLSKINWTQAVSGAAMIIAYLSGGKMSLTPDQQAALVVSIGVLGNVATWVIKTWFTATVTPSSAVQAPIVTGSIPAKAAAILAIIFLGAMFVASPGYAQTKRPAFTGRPIEDINTALHGGATALPLVGTVPSSTSGCDLTMFTGGNGDLIGIVVKIQQCVSADVGKGATALLPDWQGALDSATTAKDTVSMSCLTPALAIIKAASGTVTTPAVAAIPAVPANPAAVPPTLEIPAVPAIPEVRQYPGPVTILQKVREFGLAGGLPACKSVITTTTAMMAPVQ